MSEINVNSNKAMKEFDCWCENKHLIPNINKTKFIDFCTKSSPNDYSLLIKSKGISVERVTETKFLGFFIKENLSWDLHVSEMSKKLNTANFALYSIKKSVSKSTILSVYYAYFFSHVSLSIIFWGTEDKNIQQIFTLQKRAVRNICGLR
jgi:hypothetical protein